MDRIWKQLAIATNWPVLLAVMVLSSVGIMSIWAESPRVGQDQLKYLGVAILCMVLFQAVDYRTIGRFSIVFYVLSLILILYTVFAAVRGGLNPLPGVSRRNGAYNWIEFAGKSLQPSELMKIAFVLLLARYLRFRSNYRTIAGLLAPFALAIVPLVLILKQPDLGTALIFIPVLMAMLFVAGARVKHLVLVACLGLALTPLMWYSGSCSQDGCSICPNLPVLRSLPQLVKHYQRARVFSLFSDDPRTLQQTGYQQQHALIAFGSGGIAGKGFGKVAVGRQVPEAHNDMIFALVGEQFGFFGAAAVLGAYLILFVAGLEIASATREPFGKLIAVGIVVMLAGQAFLNLAVATKVMPVTGVTLPFISAGGSSLVASFMAAGLLLNIGQNRPIVMANNSFEFE